MRMRSEPKKDLEKATVELALVRECSRWLDTTPSSQSAGVVRLGSWQIDPITADPVSADGREYFLVKINYELTVEAGAPAIEWFEVGFSFATAGAARPVVVDALPHAVWKSQDAGTYAINRHFNFSPNNGSRRDDVYVPALAPTVDVFGVGDSDVRWRHVNEKGVGPGSRCGWVVLAVPGGAKEVLVDLTARFDIVASHQLEDRPVARGDRFRIDLRRGGRTRNRKAIVPAATSSGDSRLESRSGCRVFICYAHDDDDHIEHVRRFGRFLVDCHLDVHIDHWDEGDRQDWYMWAHREFQSADYVLVIASPKCRAVGEGMAEGDRHFGMHSEMALLRELMHRDRPTWLRKTLPVVLPGHSPDEIPLFLQPLSADHYRVTEFTSEGAFNLLRTLARKPRHLQTVVDN